MKINYLFFCLLTFVSITFSSCIKNEGLNAEADIITARIASEDMKGAVKIENSRITFAVKFGTDLKAQAPLFTLTEGATIVPASGTTRDFTTPQIYSVTSQDGNWSKTYTVSFNDAEASTLYKFDTFDFQLDERNKPEKWYSFFELAEDGTKFYPWANANPSFSLTDFFNKLKPIDFPTTVEIDNGFEGSSLRLQTESTGPFGTAFGKPIAAGNLFLGSYDPGPALSNPLLTLELGVPFNKIPVSITGKVNYVSGPRQAKNENGSLKVDKDGNPVWESVYIDKEVVGKDDLDDKFDIYAIFFENEVDEKPFHLDGTNKFTHPNVVSIAKIDESLSGNTDGWASFSIPFRYKDGMKIDLNKLNNNKYSITILMTSSSKGDDFTGAVGSTLLVDNVEIIYEK